MRTLLASLLLLGKLHFYRRDPPLNKCHHFEAHNVRHYCTPDRTVNPFHVRNGNGRRLPWKLRLTKIGTRFNDRPSRVLFSNIPEMGSRSIMHQRERHNLFTEKKRYGRRINWLVPNKMWIATDPNIEFIYPRGAISFDVTVAYRRH